MSFSVQYYRFLQYEVNHDCRK